MRAQSARYLLALALMAVSLPAAASAGRIAPPASGELPSRELVRGDGDGAMAVNAAGERWSAWTYRRGLETDIAVSVRVGRVWAPAALLTTPDGLADTGADIAFLPDGRLVVAWLKSVAEGQPGVVMISVGENDRFSTPRPVSGMDERVRAPSFLDAGERLLLAWVSDEGLPLASALEVNPTLSVRVRDSKDQRDSVVASLRGEPSTSTSAEKVDDGGGSSGHGGSNGPDPIPVIYLPPPHGDGKPQWARPPSLRD
jgi:hypothetical protein